MAALLAALSAGCGESNSSGASGDFMATGGAGGGAGEDVTGGTGGTGGTAAPNLDGGISGLEDNPVEQLLADPQRNPFDFLATDAQDTQGYAQAAALCYAASDSCGGAGCNAFATCCVDSGSCCKPNTDNPPLPELIDFAKCQGQTLEGCAEGDGFDADTFGPLQPSLTARGLVPNGTVSADGGGIVGEPVNLASELVRLQVQFSMPVGCNGSCLESAGVAFTASQPDLFVDADVGLLLSGSREVVSLLVGGSVVDSFDAGSDSTVWSLSLSPSGRVELERDGSFQGSYAFDAPSLTSARLVFFGRNLLPEASSATITSVALEAQFCDNPRAWADRVPMNVFVQGNASPTHASARDASIERHAGLTKVAFEVDGEIFVADREVANTLNLPDNNPALLPTEPYEAMGLGDPELVSGGEFLLLFYTARDANGMGSIAGAVSAAAPEFVKGTAPILVPNGDVVSFEAPSVTFRDGLWLMVVRATLSTGATELQAFYTSDVDGGWARIVNGGLEELTRVEDPTSEVTDPSLLVHNSAYHLYYGRRSGTRWSVELAVSDEMLLWRDLGEAMGGSGDGFDSLGARSPDAMSRGDQIDLVYGGQDGVSFQLGAASRAAPADTAPSIF